MSGVTKIEWTDRTWNPVVGCTKVSAGCRSCYAKTLHDQRHKAYLEGKLQNMPQYAEPFETVQLVPDRLTDPLSWRKPSRVFVNSVSDLFHEDVPDYFIAAVFGIMAALPRHTFQVLTKRPARMLGVLSRLTLGESFLRAALALDDEGFDTWRRTDISPPWPLPNVWLGVSVENQAAADERIPLLLQTPAAIHFLSCEPLLGPVDLQRWLGSDVGQYRSGDVSLDDQMRENGGEECSNVIDSPNRPRSDRLPAAPLGASAIPTDVAADRRLQPSDDLGRGAVDRDTRSGDATDSAPQPDVPFAVEQAGDISKLRGVDGHNNGYGGEAGPFTAQRPPERGESSLDGGSGRAEVCGNGLDGAASRVRSVDALDRQHERFHNSEYIDWVIVGGESGAGARVCDLDWLTAIVADCDLNGVPCFVKQLGRSPVQRTNGVVTWPEVDLRDRHGGDMAEWPDELRVRQFPEART